MAPTDSDVISPERTTASAIVRLPLVLCVLFLISGSSGLIYEVVWLRMLSRTLGSTVYAASTILAVFMGGLALGSFLFGRFADGVRRPLVLYAILEAGIGATALLSLGMNSWPVPVYRAVYNFAGDSRAALTFAQVILAMAALLVPTALMGATLPTLSAYGVRRSPLTAQVVGTLYALNTLGAMVGVLVGGFILIGAIGERHTILIGAAINGLVAALALIMSQMPMTRVAPQPEITADSPTGVAGNPASRRVRRTVLFCFAISGFVSLALEIVWSRMLALYEGTSVYAFSAMLLVMLAGIGSGGWLGRRVIGWKDPLLSLARLELGVAFAAAAGFMAFGYMEHAWIFLPPLLMVGPAAFMLGIAFPVAVRCYAAHANTIARNVGELYAWNTIGCILGSLAGGFVLVPFLGAAHTGAVLAGLGAIASLALFAVHPRGMRSLRLGDISMLLVTAAATILIGDPYRDVIFSRLLSSAPEIQIFGHVEQAAAATTSSGIPRLPLMRQLLVNGYGMTALVTGNKLMAHLPLWLSDSPHDALVICMGMGTTFRSATRHPNIDVTVVELVPAVPTFMHFYHADADRVMAQSNAHVVVDDGRNYLLMHDRQFDIITIDPAPPLYSAGTVNLYTTEFFQLCSRRLRPSGALSMWIPPAAMSDTKMIMGSFAAVFPHISVWAGPTYPGFYVIGTLRPVNDVEARVHMGFTDPATVSDLVEWDNSCATPDKVLALRLCDRDQLLAFASDQPNVTDDHPYTEFPLWRMQNDPEYSVRLTSDYFRSWMSHRSPTP